MKTSHRATIHVRTEQLRKYRAVAKVSSIAALARRMEVHPTTVSRTLSGQSQLGVEFIAGLLGAFPELQFGDLFAVEYADQGGDVDEDEHDLAEAMSA